MVPVKYFAAAMKESYWPMGRSTGATSPVQWWRRRRFRCPSPRGSKRQEATATPWTSSRAPEGRTCTSIPPMTPSVPHLPTCSVQRGFQSFPLRDLLQINKLLLLRPIGIFLQLWYLLGFLLQVKTSRRLKIHTTPALSCTAKPVALRTFGSCQVFFL